MCQVQKAEAEATMATTRRRTYAWLWFAFGGLVLTVFILDCSGLLFPVIGKQASLVNGLKRDLGVTAPSSLKVVQAVRQATRDPAYCYGCDISPGDIAAFRAELVASGGRVGNTLRLDSEDRRIAIGRSPDWFRPYDHPDIERIEIGYHEPSGSYAAYWFFLSSADRKVYVYWFST
jgi:hypothetical protein